MKIELELLKQSVANWEAQIDYEKKFVGHADPAHVIVLEMQKNRLRKLEGAMKVEHKGRSSTYCFSVNNTEGGKKEIADFRHRAKIFNAEEKLKSLESPGYDRKIRKIAMYGRLGKNNSNADKYKVKTGWGNPYARIRIEDAATIDVYSTDYVKRSDSYGNSWLKSTF